MWISDLVVAAGIIEQGSVEKALSGGHYKRCNENTQFMNVWQEE